MKDKYRENCFVLLRIALVSATIGMVSKTSDTTTGFPLKKLMDEQIPCSSEHIGDNATHVVLTHLQARVLELEAQVASLQQKQPTEALVPQLTRLTRLTQWKNQLASFLSDVVLPRLHRWFGSRPRVSISRILPTGDATATPTTTVQQQPQPRAHPPTQATTESIVSLETEEAELAELPLMIQLTSITLFSVLLGWASEYLLPFAFVPWVFYVVAAINGSFYSVQEAWASLKQRQFDVNLLMIAAALGAALVGQPREGAILMFLFSLSQTLETYAMGRTHASIRALIDMTPRTARVVRTQDNTEQEIQLPIEQVAVDDVVRVRPGEQVPADGMIVRGVSSVNEASITGESMPVEKQPDSRVFAGTLNVQGAIDVRVTTVIADSTLAQIVKIVREAREQKARSQHFTDRVIGQYYAYTVVGITLLTIVIPLIFLGWDTRTTVYRAITLMVGASPCALVISIPAAILSALASASWNGVLFKGGRHLESASQVKVIAFDKTGTLTIGRPGVTAVIPLEEAVPSTIKPASAPAEDGALSPSQSWVLGVAAAIERFSEHPLAQAIVTEARNQHIVLPDVSNFEALAGFGARATLGTQRVQIGRPSLFDQVQEGTLPATAAELLAEQERKGCTVILVGEPAQVWGMIALMDTVRPESAQVVAELKQAGVQRVVLLTGDNRLVAEHLGQLVGVDEVRAGLTPGQKVEAIRELQVAYGPVAMIGDGVNDAPALAAATLGVAMGATGTDVAMESADVVLVSDEIRRLPSTLRLARRTRRVVWQNLVFAFSVMLVLVVLAITGILPLTLATVAHEGSTLLVVANGLRLLAPSR